MTLSRRTLFSRVVSTTLASVLPPLVPRGTSYEKPADLNDFRGPIRLNMNENAYGLSENAAASIRSSVLVANRYSNAERQSLKKTIAKYHNIDPDQVILGGGSSAIMRAAAACFLGPGKKLITSSLTFDVMSREARRLGFEVEQVALTREYSHDLERMLSLARGSGGLIYICNPNNPTGSLTSRVELESFIRKIPPGYYVLIDEAYHHYVPVTPAYASFIDNPVDAQNLIVSRTFSKIGGLAGERIGYAAASSVTSQKFPRFELESSLSVSGVRAAVATLADRDFLNRCTKQNADDRQEFLNQVNARHGHVVDPHANFVFMHAGRPAQEVIDHCEKHGVLVGPAFPQMNTHVRVSLGTPVEMEQFWHLWDLLIPAGMMHM